MSAISKAIYLLVITIILFSLLLAWKTNKFPPGQQVLPNPSWNPTTINGPDGGRDWTCTSNAPEDCAYQVNDVWNGSIYIVSDGSKGFLVAKVDGVHSNDFQYAQSPWFPTRMGETWFASVYAYPELQQLNGDQVGLLKIEFADTKYNVLKAAQTNVITSSSPDMQYWPGSITLSAGPGAAYVHIQVGVLNPTPDNDPSHALFDNALLKPVAGSARSIMLFGGTAVLLLTIIAFYVNYNRGK